MTHVFGDNEILAALHPWDLPEPITITKAPDGATGSVWYVTSAHQRYVAK